MQIADPKTYGNIYNINIIDSCPIPITIIAADTTIIYANNAFERITGYGRSEVVGLRAPYPWHPEVEDESTTRRKRALYRDRWGEQQLRKKNGNKFWVEFTNKEITLDESGDIKVYFVYWVDVTERNILRQNTEYYISQITRAQEAERKRISRDIHDGAIQMLASLALSVDSLAKEKNNISNGFRLSLQDLRERINAILHDLRFIIDKLRPGVIDQVGLLAALENMVEDMREQPMNKINVTISVYGKSRRLQPEMELMLFRIVQESLNNAWRHSGADQAKVNVRYNRHSLRLTIADNGTGFMVPERITDLASTGRLGIVGMQERVKLLNGILNIKSRVGKGTVVQATCPIPE